MKVLHAGKKEIWIEIGGIKMAGTYRKGDEGTKDIQEWVENCEKIAANSPRIAIGDWNAHHPTWSLRGTSSARGRYLEQGMTQLGLEVDNTHQDEPTFQRGTTQMSRIDLIFKSTDLEPQRTDMEWVMSDHSLLYYTLDLQKPLPPNSSKMTTDTNKLHTYLESIGKLEETEQQQWYKNLPKATPYDQLLDLTLKFQRNLRISGKSKKWWDSDLKKQLKNVRQSARGGQETQARTHNPQRWKKWKQEKGKMKRMIRDKKRACWQRFLNENGSKDPWEVIRMAKNPWGRKERMKVHKTMEGEEIPEAEQGAAMEKAHFLWDKTKVAKGWEAQGPGIEK